MSEESTGDKRVHVEFCGQLHEQAGTRSQSVRTTAGTAAELWDELRERNRLTLDQSVVRAAINDRIQPWTHPIRDEDRVALFPPFSGG
ncbi:MAG: MoaD/ThiS family protein [Akkermansiaceae bacterium]|nr:MoaD/ThiS family protein [Akkermansiaceae bacterium]